MRPVIKYKILILIHNYDLSDDVNLVVCTPYINFTLFQDSVMVHMQHIQQGLSQMGNLTAFMATATTASADCGTSQ